MVGASMREIKRVTMEGEPKFHEFSKMLYTMKIQTLKQGVSTPTSAFLCVCVCLASPKGLALKTQHGPPSVSKYCALFG